MFKYLIFFAAIGLSVAVIPRRPFYGQSSGGHSSSSSRASGDERNAEIKSMHSEVRADGFDYALETSNGIKSTRSGDANGNIQGGFQWISPDGQQMQISYVADENGYQPKGDLLPTPPPIPDAILRALEYIRTHPPKEESKRPLRPSAPSSYTPPKRTTIRPRPRY
ncbi:PREDICTED: larval cuticle protein 4-like [Rhagoletis zephyria]|uniref:larval cuticle protein 4-like n=1 Tax=Rhagoletis zephyria TaxID=28612 RepID=UPI0008115177|nr:PREDICTED: larval cuticle protein 4-like [Rhagoletis zephyria]XP_017471239.1 PREDICTED: larval cuticle protein 4-like [Rhagoletis zephyria]